jgi:predicted dehydrogenase
MTQLRIGVFGAGMIAQIEHVPNLLRLKDRFHVVGVADPSARARRFMADRFGLATMETLEQLFSEKLDAMLIAAPDFLHSSSVEMALRAGLHVLVEKPLCYGPADADTVANQQAKAGRIVQVAYMKRFDPSFEAAAQLVAGAGKRLRYISVEKTEPKAIYQMAHHDYQASDDLPAAVIAAGRDETKRQVERAVGGPIAGAVYRAYTGPFCSSLVHDVNLVHGMLDSMGIGGVKAVAAAVFSDGDGGNATMRINGGQALWQMTHLYVPSLADYRERLAFHFDDMILELIFPSPYLNHQPTRLIVQRSAGHRFEQTEIRDGYAEPYIRELEGFWQAVVEGVPVRTGIEHARRDLALISDIGRLAALDNTI